MKQSEVELGELCIIDWGNTSLTKKAYLNNGKYLAVSATGGDGRIDHFEHPAFTPVISAIGAQCGKLFLPKEKFTAIKNTITLTPNKTGVPYESKFLYYLLSSLKLPRRGAGQPFISKGDLEKFKIIIPPLDEQKRIANFLDRCQRLHNLIKKKQIPLIDELKKSIFQKYFGDPAFNPKGFKIKNIRSTSIIFSDGPFGSNLKSSHYSNNGIRVIRLQNIGDGVFIDDDKAFIPIQHYEKLKKHTCLPGDLIIGTLGNPNLRSFIQPNSLPICINKADCVQMRCDKKQVKPHYINALLNYSSTRKMAERLILGQTRGRISMGRLATLEIPVPPLDLQISFEKSIKIVEKSLLTKSKSLTNQAAKLMLSFQSKELI